jgi:hypothetical protein
VVLNGVAVAVGDCANEDEHEVGSASLFPQGRNGVRNGAH